MTDWGKDPQEYNLENRGDLAELKRRYAWLDDARASPGPQISANKERPLIRWLFAYIQGADVTRAIVEPYIDGDYHDEFSNFYSYTFEPPALRCERVHLWSGGRYVGYVSLRPVPGGPICRSLLTPTTFGEWVTCLVTGEARPFGHDLRVRGFPFLGQDSQYGRCAHAAVWMVSYYHHLANRTPRFYMSDIVRAAEQREYERVMPSAGLTDEQVGVACHRLGMPVRMYTRDNLPAGETMESVITRYLDSSVPLILGWWWGRRLTKHMTVGIGYQRRSTSGVWVIHHDDGRGAYMANEVNDDLRVVIVPVPDRAYLPGHAAARFAELQWEGLRKNVGFELDVACEVRTYLTHSRRYKARLESRQVPIEARSTFKMTVLPRWIWIAEIHDVAARANREEAHVIGELIIDATSDSRNPQMIVGFVPGQLVEWNRVPGADPATLYRTEEAVVLHYGSGIGAESVWGVQSLARFANVATSH